MPYALVEEQLHTIPEAYMPEIMEFLTLLKYKVMYEQLPPENKTPPFKRELGILKGQIKIADDFDETPECFKEYL